MSDGHEEIPPGGEEDEGRWVRTTLKVLGVAALVVVLFGGAYAGVKVLAGMVNDALGGSDQPAGTGEAVEVEIPAGSSAARIGRLLAEAGVISSAPEFERAVRLQQVSDRLQAGNYELEKGMPVDAVIARLVEGPGGGVVRVTLIEGLTVPQMLGSLAEQADFEVGDLEAPLLNGLVTSDLLPEGADSLASWEGLLFPDTYEIFADDEPADVLQLLADTAELRVASVDWAYLTERGLTPYDGIIIASMIEREARLDEERPIIASVIFNRLDQGMLLQIDATVVYVLGGLPEGGLTLDDLQVDSPYNTYRYEGLPPTPIAGARLASLRAAAAPSQTTYLYYVLFDDEGRHAFTDDFDEFLRLQQEAREAGLIP
ncbi:MAG TPA: endolytic transglycosylase MltG [Acidimicrobiia bacterium]|nr:endolytic transglycosylase MltG [Acidimicrobiia bacterium]